MSLVSEAYINWCEGYARYFMDEADVASDLGLKDRAKRAISDANKLFAEANDIRSGKLVLNEGAMLRFLNKERVIQ